MASGRATPKPVVDFIVETSKNAPELGAKKLAEKVEATYKHEIDQSTVWKILQRAKKLSVHEPTEGYPTTAVLPASLLYIGMRALDTQDAYPPNQFIEMVKMDHRRLAQRALSLSFPGNDSKSVYDSLIQRHAREADYSTNAFAALSPHSKHLQEIGLWSYIETWEKCFHVYFDRFLDFSDGISRFVDLSFKHALNDATKDRGNDEQDRQADQVPTRALSMGNLRHAFTIDTVPELLAAVLLSDLLALAAEEQPTNPIWATELLALKNLRTRAVIYIQTLMTVPIDWSKFNDLASKIWEDEELFGEEREKAVATADAYIKAEHARVESRENIMRAISEY